MERGQAAPVATPQTTTKSLKGSRWLNQLTIILMTLCPQSSLQTTPLIIRSGSSKRKTTKMIWIRRLDKSMECSGITSRAATTNLSACWQLTSRMAVIEVWIKIEWTILSRHSSPITLRSSNKLTATPISSSTSKRLSLQVWKRIWTWTFSLRSIWESRRPRSVMEPWLQLPIPERQSNHRWAKTLTRSMMTRRQRLKFIERLMKILEAQGLRTHLISSKRTRKLRSMSEFHIIQQAKSKSLKSETKWISRTRRPSATSSSLHQTRTKKEVFMKEKKRRHISSPFTKRTSSKQSTNTHRKMKLIGTVMMKMRLSCLSSPTKQSCRPDSRTTSII